MADSSQLSEIVSGHFPANKDNASNVATIHDSDLSDSDSEVLARRTGEQQSDFILNECECSSISSDDNEKDSSSTTSCSHPSFIDDNDAFIDDEPHIAFNPDSGVETLEIMSEQLSHKLDSELAAVQRQITAMNYTELTAFLVCIAPELAIMSRKLENIPQTVTSLNALQKSLTLWRFAQDFMPNLKAVTTSTWDSVVRHEHSNRTRFNPSTAIMLKNLQSTIHKYIEEDIIMSDTCCKADVDTVYRDIASLFSQLKPEHLSTWCSINMLHQVSTEIPKRTTVAIAPKQSTPVRNESLESFSLPVSSSDEDEDSNSLPTHSTPVVKRRKLDVCENPDLQSLINGQCDEEYGKWMANVRFKSQIQEYRKNISKMNIDALTVVTAFQTYFSKIMAETRCSVLAATRGALDVIDAHLSAATYDVIREHSVDSHDESIPLSQMSVSIGHKPFPGDEIIAEVLLWKQSDQRFIALDAGWKYRDYSSLGIFEPVPQPQANKKNIYMCLYGIQHTTKFHEHVETFMKFTGQNNYVAKTGIYSVQTKPRVQIHVELVQQIMHIVLTMSRATTLALIAQQLVHFTDSIDIPRSMILIAAFNNDEDFKCCYSDVDAWRKTAPESGFVGPPDIKLRKKLGCETDNAHEAQAFRIMFEAMRRDGVKTQAQAVEYITRVLSDPSNETEEKKVFQTFMQSGQAATTNLKNALWWNDMMAKRKHVFTKSELGRVTVKLAVQLFQDIKDLFGGHLLNPLVDIENWDESTMGPMRMKGTLFQPAIWNIIMGYMRGPTDLLTILKLNKISPVRFFNVYYGGIVLQKRRQKTVIFSGDFMTGKSITAGCIFDVHDGKRVTLEHSMSGGNNFIIDSISDPASDIGVVVLDDVSAKSFKIVDTRFRPQLDGDEHVINVKYGTVGRGQWPGVVITTNVPLDSDSEPENVKASSTKKTLSGQRLLCERYNGIKFRTSLRQLESELGIHKQIAKLDPCDLLKMYWRYAFLPTCNALFEHGPRCQFAPCKSVAFEDHHPMCPLVREILSNVKFGVRCSTSVTSVDNKDTMNEYYERIHESTVGATFDLQHIEDVRQCLKLHMGVSDLDLGHITDLVKLQTMQTKIAEIDHFVEKVWTPLCYLSAYMCGRYTHIQKKCYSWAHNHIMENKWFVPLNEEDDIPLTMADLISATNTRLDISVEDLNMIVKSHWNSHPRINQWTIVDSDELPDKFSNLVDQDMRRLLFGVRKYIMQTSDQKKWKRYTRSLKLTFEAGDFGRLWGVLLGSSVKARTSHLSTPTKNTLVDARYYD